MSPALALLFWAFVASVVSSITFFALSGLVHILPIRNKSAGTTFAAAVAVHLFVVISTAPVLMFVIVGYWDAPP